MPAPGRRQSGGKLTDQQEKFCREYLVSLNAATAAVRAGYSARTALKKGSQVIGNPRVQARLAELTAERNARNQVDADFVLRRLLDEVNADAADLFDDDGRLLPVKQWPEAWRRGLVTTIRTREIYGRGAERATQIGVQTDIVLVDRARRIELLGRHIKVNAFAADQLNIGLLTPLQELFQQIAGNVIRPASEKAKVIEHDATPKLQGKRGQGGADDS